MSLLELIGLLMDYPRDELWQRREELLDAVARQALPPRRRAELEAFVRGLLDAEPPDVQDDWLSYFDRSRPMSLALFEHIHGDTHARTQAMVDLEDTFLRNGFELGASEVPDHLPLVLDYLSQRPIDDAVEWLREIYPVVAVLAAQAREIGSPYDVLFGILMELADGTLAIEAEADVASPVPRQLAPSEMAAPTLQ
jgi:nitrate reductase delta subunit